MSEFRTNVADLLHHPGARRAFVVDGPLEGLTVGAARLDGDVHCDFALEHVPDGVVVRGAASGNWSSECSRCLAPVSTPFRVAVAELFEANPIEGETYPLVDERIDVELPLRDAIAGELQPAPLCREDCAGLCPVCGIDRNTATCECETTVVDNRWDALNELHLSD